MTCPSFLFDKVIIKSKGFPSIEVNDNLCGVSYIFVRIGLEKTHLVKETPPEKINIPNSFVQTIPMNHLGRESCSAMASMIPVFHLHCTVE